MITKEQKLRLAAFLILSFFLLAAIASVFILPRLKDEGDIYSIDFQKMSVNGVNEGADVKYQGVRIGKVVSLEVNPEDLRSILICVKIKKGFPVKKDMGAALQYAGITGLRFVEISGGTNEAENLEPGGRIMTKKGLGEKAEDIVLNIDSVVEAINDMLNKENRDKISQLLTNLEKSASVISETLAQKKENLGNSIENIDAITTQLKEVAAGMNAFVDYINTISERIPPEKVEEMVANADRLIKNISDRFSEKEVGKTLERLNTFIETATVSIKKIEGSFHDVENELTVTLADVRESLENISRFTRDLSEDPTILLRKRPEKRSKK
jgi:phospholipid/cholesterol/gamma-HCH transport system substrate-binding protein